MRGPHLRWLVAWVTVNYEELGACDRTSLEVLWLKDRSPVDLVNLPDPEDLAERIIENLEAGIDSFGEVLATLR